MLCKSVVLATLLAASTNAAPLSVSTLLTSALESLLESVGVSLQTNAAKHGKASSGIEVTDVALSNSRYTHDIVWPPGYTSGGFLNWTTFKGNGVNLGDWLEIEESNLTPYWDSYNTGAGDEWNFCEDLGSRCAAVMEKHFATFITKSDIDNLAKTGINVLRVATTYAAWVKVPGSQLYHGNQKTYLRKIARYAIQTYNMHVIIGLHSLPGGVNDLDIGESFGHDNWFFNTTNLKYSFQAIDSILSFIIDTGYTNGFTISPLNEASDNITGFATPYGLTESGTDWINTYINGVLKKVGKVDKRIPVMLQDSFLGEEYWSPFYAAGTNLVIDTHVYYFAASGVYSQYVAPAICGQASTLSGDGKFPVFVGEWSLQVLYNNTYSGRKTIFDTQRYAWQEYVSGGSFWTAKFSGNASVNGQGDQSDYWNYLGLYEAGVITEQTNSSYC